MSKNKTYYSAYEEMEAIKNSRHYKMYLFINKYPVALKSSFILFILFSFTGIYIYFTNGMREIKEQAEQAAYQNTKNNNAAAAPKNEIVKQNNDVLQKLDSNINLTAAETVYKEAASKLEEVNTLREEITTLLKGKNTEENLTTAQVKVYLLQEKVATLQTRFLEISDENRRLQLLLKQILTSKKLNTTNAGLNTNKPSKTERVISQMLEDEASLESGSNAAIATGLHLFAVADNNETNQSLDADKIVGSFVLKNITNKVNAEVVVVVLQPDGKVLKNSVWESGTFETKEGKKVYSRKIIFNADTIEKQVNFSLTPDNFSKGNYTMQVWYNGSMIAKMIKTLS